MRGAEKAFLLPLLDDAENHRLVLALAEGDRRPHRRVELAAFLEEQALELTVLHAEEDLHLDQRAEFGFGAGPRCHQRVDLLVELLRDGLVEELQEVVLAAEVVVDRRLGDAADVGDFLHRSAAEPLVFEQGHRALEDVRAHEIGPDLAALFALAGA